MEQRPSAAALRAVAAVLTGPRAARVLREALDAEGAALRDSAVRSVHRRGQSSLAVVHRVELVDRHGRARDRLYVTHATSRGVPGASAVVDVGGIAVHVWPFPHDPYLPGLPDAVNVGAAAALLRRVGVPSVGPAAIRTRSYRPTRRAVVELRPATTRPPAVYVKLLGGRGARVARRTRRLVAVHTTLGTAGLPVPDVLEHDPHQGRVVLAAVPGHTLRQLLRSGSAPPQPERLMTLLARLHASPPLPGTADPDGFADIERHVRLLRTRLPHRRSDLDRLATAAAAVGGPIGTVHGDLHDGQLVVGDGGVIGLLDVDGAGTGHVAHDLGRLLAGIEASRLTATGQATEHAARYLRDVRAAALGRCPGPDLRAATAAAWVGLATGPLRVASPTWRRETEERLDRAVAGLDGP